MIPITRIDEYLAVISQDEDATGLPDQAVTRIDTYLSKIAGEAVAELPEPVTRIDRYLASIAGMDVVMYDPITRIDYYLATVAGVYSGELPEPVTRIDHYLYNWAEGGSPPWQTFVGNPVQFNAPKAHVLKSVKVEFSPIQDLHGYANPWPAGGGKNKIDVADVTLTGSTYVFNLSGLNIPSGTYTISYNTTASASASFAASGAGGDYVNTSISVSSNKLTFTASGEITGLRLYGGAGTYSKIQLELGPDATSFAPYSNECPISGWTAIDVYGAGENLLKLSGRTPVTSASSSASSARDFSAPFAYIGITANNYFTNSNILDYAINDDNINVTVKSGASGYGVGLNVSVTPETQYTISFKNQALSVMGIGYYGADGKIINSFPIDSATKWTFTTPANCVNLMVVFRPTAGVEYTFEEPMLNLGSSASPYSPHTGETISVTWQDEAGTVYGGYLLFNEDGSVDLIGTRARRKLSEMPSASWNKLSSGTGAFFMARTTAFPGIRYPFVGSTWRNNISDKYKYSSTGTQGEATYRISDALYIVDSRFSDLAEWLSFISDTDAAFVYDLATPVTYHLPSVEALQALQGINTIWSDANGKVTAVARANAVNLTPLQSLNMLLGGRYVNNHTAEDLTDEEALDVILGR